MTSGAVNADDSFHDIVSMGDSRTEARLGRKTSNEEMNEAH